MKAPTIGLINGPMNTNAENPAIAIPLVSFPNRSLNAPRTYKTSSSDRYLHPYNSLNGPKANGPIANSQIYNVNPRIATTRLTPKIIDTGSTAEE
jgi:hypothetical protein